MSRTWYRLEPKTLGADATKTLTARILDPLWLLHRQWQLGEFRAEDAGSPAWAEVTTQSAALDMWRTPAGTWSRWRNGPAGSAPPLPAVATCEQGGPAGLAVRAELGRLFERILGEATNGAVPVAGAFRDRCVFPIRSVAELRVMSRGEAAFYRTIAGTRWDGQALLEFAADHPEAELAALVEALGTDGARVARALVRLRTLATLPAPNPCPATWNPARLEHSLEVAASNPLGAPTATLLAEPNDEGDLEWYSFDRIDPTEPLWVDDGTTQRIVPGHVQFAGMPNHRWWDFEDSASALATTQVEQGNLSRLVFLNFLLVAGNDWFLLPLDARPGSLNRVKGGRIRVRDVFGVDTVIGRTEAARGEGFMASSPPGRARWTMFSTAVAHADQPDRQPALADWLLVPPDGGQPRWNASVLEEVRFGRDEMSNLAWAAEITVQDALGAPVSMADLARERGGEAPSTPPRGAATLRYKVQTPVADGWIPFVPVAAGGASDLSGQIDLQRGRLWVQGEGIRPPAAGAILQAVPEGAPYRLREEELPREGVRVLRAVTRGRGVDGRTHTWVRWLRRVGRGEIESRLRYDVLEPDK